MVLAFENIAWKIEPGTRYLEYGTVKNAEFKNT